MLFYGAAVTPLTGLAELWWKKQAGDTLPPELVFRHQWLGIGLAVLFVVLAVWRWRIYRESGVPRWGYLVLCLVSVAALVIQGSLGRAMLFGS